MSDKEQDYKFLKESPKPKFFARAGSYLKKNPILSAAFTVLFMIIAYLLLQEEGVLFVIGFCTAMLAVATLWITLRGLRKT